MGRVLLGNHCDDIVRLIDAVLGDEPAGLQPAVVPAADEVPLPNRRETIEPGG